MQVLHREARTLSDKIAYNFVRLLRSVRLGMHCIAVAYNCITRWGFDIASGYKHKPLPPNAKELTLDDLRRDGYLMDESQWLKVGYYFLIHPALFNAY